MWNELSVAVRDELVSACFEFLPSLDIIEQLTVEDYRDAAVLIGNRLLSIGQTDNAQPACSES